MDAGQRQELSDQFERATDAPMLMLALVFLPVVIAPLVTRVPDDVARPLQTVDWAIWAVFAAELVIKTYLAPRRRHYLLSHLDRIARQALLDDLRRLGAYVAGTGLLKTAALAAMRDAALADARCDVGSSLQILRVHAGPARAAEICSLPRATFERRVNAMDSCDLDRLAALRQAREPYRDTLAELAGFDEQASKLETETAALRESIASDPHTKYVQWLDRTHLRYDRAAWQRGRLTAVRDPARRGPGGWYRVETVDYSDILDREAQQLGGDFDVFMGGVDRMKVTTDRLADLGFEAKRTAIAVRDRRTRLR